MRKLLLAIALIAASSSAMAWGDNPGMDMWNLQQALAMHAMEQRGIEDMRAQQDRQNAPIIIPLPVYRPAPEYYPPIIVQPQVNLPLPKTEPYNVYYTLKCTHPDLTTEEKLANGCSLPLEDAKQVEEDAKQVEKTVPPTEFEFTPEGMKVKDIAYQYKLEGN